MRFEDMTPLAQVIELLKRRPMSIPEMVRESGRSLATIQYQIKHLLHTKYTMKGSPPVRVYELLKGEELERAARADDDCWSN